MAAFVAPPSLATSIQLRIHRFISVTSVAHGASKGTARWLLGFCHAMGHSAFHSSHWSLVRGARPGTEVRSGASANRSTRSLTGAGHAPPSGVASEHSHSSTRSEPSSPSRLCTRLTCVSALSGALADTSLSCRRGWMRDDEFEGAAVSAVGSGFGGCRGG